MLGFMQVADDNLYNRRRMAVLAFAWAVVWCFVVLGIDLYFDLKMETVKLTVYLGVPSAVCGLPIWQYFKAAGEETK